MNPYNVNPDEINKFSQDCDTWWDTNGHYKTLHDLNPLRHATISKHCALTDKVVLDVGCGGGIFAETLAHDGAHVTAIDANSQAIDAATTHAKQSKLAIDYQFTTIEQLATHHQKPHFDAVTCMEMLEHVPDPESIVQNCTQLTKPGGWVFFSTLNKTLTSYLHAIVGAEYLLNILPRGTHQHDQFITPAQLCNWSRHAGLNVIELIGIGHNPLSGSYFPQASLSVNYIACFRKTTEN